MKFCAQREFKVPHYSPELQRCFSHDGFIDNDIDMQRLHPEQSDAINVRLKEIPNNPMKFDLSDEGYINAMYGKELDNNEIEQLGYQQMSEILSEQSNNGTK